MLKTDPATGLPPLDNTSAAHEAAVIGHLRQLIDQTPDGFITLETWMDQALYAPGLGYYAAGNTKFGSDLPVGDFTTAPELTPLFGATLARQVTQVLQQINSVNVLEFGAGSGALAASLIPALQALGIDVRYQILEVSADLQARQQKRLSGFGQAVQWLHALPESFSGCVLANEVLDAMPATVFTFDAQGVLLEVGVRNAAVDSSIAAATATPVNTGTEATITPSFLLATRPAAPQLQQLLGQRVPVYPGYQSEINVRAEAWVREMGSWLHAGAALLIDYGFPQREYYHPQRADGTLMCHFRHHAHANVLLHPGLQDITTHVDFTAMADAALAGGLDVLGYTSQARFLMNAGLPELLGNVTHKDLSAVQKLLSEAEMGELFKVLAVGKGVDPPLLGFSRGDRRHGL